MATPVLNYISEKEYVEAERAAFEKHGYIKGEIFAMSGVSFNHNKIFSKLFVDLGSKLKGKSCEPYGSDLRIHIPENSLYTYPDISIICGELESNDDNSWQLTDYKLLTESFSISTVNINLTLSDIYEGVKFD